MSQPSCTRVSIDKLIVDPRYQRPVEEKRVTRIINNFDPRQLGTIEVSQREDGTYAVIDGQHRFEALKTTDRKMISALVHEGLSVKEEADLFAKINMGRKPLSPIQRFRAQVFAGHPRAVDIANIVTRCGFTMVSGTNTGNGSEIRAVSGIEQAYNNYGREALEQALTTIRDVWFGEQAALDSHMIKGMSIFCLEYGNRFDEHHAERLRQISALSVLRRAQERSVGHSSSRTKLYIADELRRRTGLRGTAGRKGMVVMSKKASDEAATV